MFTNKKNHKTSKIRNENVHKFVTETSKIRNRNVHKFVTGNYDYTTGSMTGILGHVSGEKKTHDPTGTRTSHIPCEHSDHWATEPHGRPVTISPHTGHQMSKGRKKHMARPGRTQDLSHTVRTLWPLSYRATRSIRHRQLKWESLKKMRIQCSYGRSSLKL